MEPETYPLSLALFDFIPTLAFLFGAYHLVRISQSMRGTRCARMAMLGSLLIFAGGFLKALWKLLYAVGAADARLLSEIQFVLLAPGFLALMIVAILVARRKPAGQAAGAAGKTSSGAAPLLAIAVWKMPLLAIMTLTSMAANGILTYLAFKRGARVAAMGFILAFLCLVGMGAMASGEQSLARQWTEEIINAVGQIGFALGALVLHRDVTRNGC